MKYKSRNDLDDLYQLKDHLLEAPAHLGSRSFVSSIVNARLDAAIQELESRNSNRRYIKKTWMKPETTTTKMMKKKKPKTFFDKLLTTGRFLTVDLPIGLLFFTVILSTIIQRYYSEYMLPTIDAANWADDDASRLKHEFTYYARRCDATDVTTSNLDDLALTENSTVAQAVNNFMTHGMSLMPNVLDRDMSDDLRNYILKRNMELTQDEVIPLDGARNRWSFGIHAIEDPSITRALQHIGSNTFLKQSLEQMLGKDPAVAEITAITVAPGADAQGWHPDVKPLGNSIKYAQTFTHSYSLFVPLQDVTPIMGATEVCPGTHYCSDEDLWDVCLEKGFQASKADQHWKAGDGLVMNQKMWHRGSAYDARRGPNRVVFIVTFISRPNPGVDLRQLAHGTYFHIHPHMYGHTFNDLKNAGVTMSYPFCSLRSLGIWKPPNANWGWDWASVASLRISNSENGYHFDDLIHFVEEHSLGTLLPSFLHGPVSDIGGWEEYFEGTFNNIKLYSTVIYITFCSLVLAATVLVNVLEGGRKRRLRSIMGRLLLIHLVIAYVGHKIWTNITSTQFANSVDSKTMFARPFLPAPKRLADRKISDTNLGETNSKMELTTVPTRWDILFGKRHHSKHIGYYSNFLNYHPGNKKWRNSLGVYHDLYQSYAGLPAIFKDEVTDILEKEAHSMGTRRMLRQNDYGEWTVMTDLDVKMEVLKGLKVGKDTLLSALDKELETLAANARDSPYMRKTSGLKRATLKYTSILSLQLVEPERRHSSSQNYTKVKSTFRMPIASIKPSNTTASVHLKKRKIFSDKSVGGIEFNIGDTVLAGYHGSEYWMPAELIYKEFKKYGMVEYFYGEGQFAHGGGERSCVVLSKLRQYKAIKEGDLIAVMVNDCDRCPTTFQNGLVMKMYPDETCDIKYDSGAFERGVLRDDLVLRFDD